MLILFSFFADDELNRQTPRQLASALSSGQSRRPSVPSLLDDG